MRSFAGILLLALATSPLHAQQAKSRPKLPNIVWITSEDHGPHLGCYGDRFARTPHLDRLAKKGMIYTRAWSNAPVCAPARTTLISGLYPTSTGAEHMRSMTRLPANMFLFPYYLRQLGYYCTNKVKEDYNLEKIGKIWDDSSNKAHPKNRGAGQPFFAVFNSVKSHESQIRENKTKLIGDPAQVRVPKYHPDTPEVREDWTRYYDLLALVDADAAEVLRELEELGLLEDTIIIYFADHGPGMPRCKRMPLNSGLQVPMIVHFPEAWKHLAPPDYMAGGRSDRLVSFVDLAPTMLSIAGQEPPAWMQGRAFAGPHMAPAHEYLHGFRGRMDERYDLQRSVTDGQYVYLRNYLPHLPAGQHVEYQFQTKTTRIWKALFDAGKLNESQGRFWKAPREPEELYDLRTDPDEVINLAGAREHQTTLLRLRKAQRDHCLRIRDVGLLPEDEMHRRAAGRTPYELGHDLKQYPLERILETAELAGKGADITELKNRLGDADSGVRYWSMVGLLASGKEAVRANRDTLLRAMREDDSPSVRIVAAEALALFGPGDMSQSVPVLIAHADARKNSLYVSMTALNALDRLAERDADIAALTRRLPAEPTDAKHRAAMGVGRLLASIVRNAK